MQLPLLICPGIHDPAFTTEFLAAMAPVTQDAQIFSGPDPYSPGAIFNYWQQCLPRPTVAPPLGIIAFSAGVVGAWGAAHLWQCQGGRVQWLIALDGWGVPAWAPFPVYRLSHDGFTHGSSQILGGDRHAFYADPPVEHLMLWRSPQHTPGWQTCGWGLRHRTTAAAFMQEIICRK